MSEIMMEKRPIDRLRESAGSFKIGTPDDQSKITGIIKIGEDRLLIVKGKGIYELKLADQIDPARTNAALPNVQQRVLQYGSECVFVARTVQTAHKLFASHRFSKFSVQTVIELSLNAARELAAMQDSANALRDQQSAAVKRIEAEAVKDRTTALPEIENLEGRVKNFVQNLDHAYKALFETTQVFYGTEYRKRWFEGFHKFLLGKLKADDPFLKFVENALPSLRLFRFMRDGVEHPSAASRVLIKNFELEPSGAIVVPTIEFVHSDTPLERTQLLDFMDTIIDTFSVIYENLLAYLADRHVEQFGRFPIAVLEFKPEELGETLVRFSLAIDLGNGFTRVG